MGLIFGVAVNDMVGSSVDSDSKEYLLWNAMLSRCFSRYTKKVRPTYEGVTCCAKWLTFSKFLEDVRSMVGYERCIGEGWVLDKDILVKGNKLYSKETCCFVPKEINGCFTTRKLNRGSSPIGVGKNKTGRYHARCGYNGVRLNLGTFDTEVEAFFAYKQCKEKEIKRLADKYARTISKEVYNALYAYEVDITD